VPVLTLKVVSLYIVAKLVGIVPVPPDRTFRGNKRTPTVPDALDTTENSVTGTASAVF
jgi:hypothetical protein